VSGKGFSYGYVGGGLQLALAFGLVAAHDKFGISQTQAVRIGILGAGLWWAGFTLLTARNLVEAAPPSTLSGQYENHWFPPAAYVSAGVSRLVTTTRHVRKFRHLVLFLFSYMLYNDGIQTVINMATIYGKEELKLSTTALLVTLLIIQIVASVGSIIFSRFAGIIGTKRAIITTLVLWSLIVIYAFFIRTTAQFFAVGVVVGIVLGGSQALSRSFYGSIIPEKASAEFYGFYTVFSKLSSIWGPFLFAFIHQMTGSARNSILSIVLFFIVGLVLLYLVDEEKAREARNSTEF
jgi:UMF1 family MFS transporter